MIAAGDTADATRVGSPTLDNVPDYMKLDAAAELLGVTADDVYVLVRHGELRGVKAPKAGGWHVDRAEVLAYRARTTTTRGPRREVTITQDQLVKLLSDVQHYGTQADALRQQADAFSAKRHAAIREMYDGGLSVRNVAELLGVSASVVARMLADR